MPQSWLDWIAPWLPVALGWAVKGLVVGGAFFWGVVKGGEWNARDMEALRRGTYSGPEVYGPGMSRRRGDQLARGSGGRYDAA